MTILGDSDTKRASDIIGVLLSWIPQHTGYPLPASNTTLVTSPRMRQICDKNPCTVLWYRHNRHLWSRKSRRDRPETTTPDQPTDTSC